MHILVFFAFFYDLKFGAADIVPGNWTWIAGHKSYNAAPNYGPKGAAGVNYGPGAREFPGMAFRKSMNELWIFGGTPYSSSSSPDINDLWRYCITDNTWTWVTGSSSYDASGTYGSIGNPAPGNTPGARSALTMVIRDVEDDMFLFGGYGFGTTSAQGMMNDLWRFDFGTQMWTWVSGSNSPDSAGTYGKMGIPSSTNTPRGRWAHGMTYRKSTKEIIIFGGAPGSSDSSTPMNDLWTYSTTTNQWTWLDGSNQPGQNGVYGGKGSFGAANTPGCRKWHQIIYRESADELWTFGGTAYTSSGTSTGKMNDLWVYSFSLGQWAWIAGTQTLDAAASYGQKGVSSPSNYPGGRDGYMWAYRQTTDEIFLLGGFGYVLGAAASENDATLNDLWSFSPSQRLWTWATGSNTLLPPGSYGVKGATDPRNALPSRQIFGLAWDSNLDGLWVFGGRRASDTDYDDLWMYTPADANINSYVTSGISVSASNSITQKTTDNRSTQIYTSATTTRTSSKYRSSSIPTSAQTTSSPAVLPISSAIRCTLTSIFSTSQLGAAPATAIKSSSTTPQVMDSTTTVFSGITLQVMGPITSSTLRQVMGPTTIFSGITPQVMDPTTTIFSGRTVQVMRPTSAISITSAATRQTAVTLETVDTIRQSAFFVSSGAYGAFPTEVPADIIPQTGATTCTKTAIIYTIYQKGYMQRELEHTATSGINPLLLVSALINIVLFFFVPTSITYLYLLRRKGERATPRNIGNAHAPRRVIMLPPSFSAHAQSLASTSYSDLLNSAAYNSRDDLHV